MTARDLFVDPFETLATAWADGDAGAPHEATPPVRVLPVTPESALALGELVALADDGATGIVHGGGSTAAWVCRTTIRLDASHLGARAVVGFAGGEPVVLGLLQEPATAVPRSENVCVDVQTDGAHLVLVARERLVLRCGAASLTLTRAGKILIEGKYVLVRSAGVNRLQGGTVQIN